MALRVSGAIKPHHHDKVETPSVGHLRIILGKRVEAIKIVFMGIEAVILLMHRLMNAISKEIFVAAGTTASSLT
jgi:hypothetical protein